jgi:hypothetical protein
MLSSIRNPNSAFRNRTAPSLTVGLLQFFLPAARLKRASRRIFAPAFIQGPTDRPGEKSEKIFVASVKHCSILAPFVVDSPGLDG